MQLCSAVIQCSCAVVCLVQLCSAVSCQLFSAVMQLHIVGIWCSQLSVVQCSYAVQLYNEGIQCSCPAALHNCTKQLHCITSLNGWQLTASYTYTSQNWYILVKLVKYIFINHVSFLFWFFHWPWPLTFVLDLDLDLDLILTFDLWPLTFNFYLLYDLDLDLDLDLRFLF